MNQGRNETHWWEKKYPDRVPVLLTMNGTLHKWLVPSSQPVSSLMMSVRQRLVVKPEEALFLVVKHQGLSIMILGKDTMSSLQHQYADDQGMLHMHVLKENTFGSFMPPRA